MGAETKARVGPLFVAVGQWPIIVTSSPMPRLMPRPIKLTFARPSQLGP